MSFLESGPPTVPINLAANDSIEYDFNVTVSVPTGFNFPFGANASSLQISTALIPLVGTFNLVTMYHSYSENGNLTSAMWVDKPIVGGMSTFCLFSYDQLDSTQIQSLTNDLFNALTAAMNGTA